MLNLRLIFLKTLLCGLVFGQQQQQQSQSSGTRDLFKCRQMCYQKVSISCFFLLAAYFHLNANSVWKVHFPRLFCLISVAYRTGVEKTIWQFFYVFQGGLWIGFLSFGIYNFEDTFFLGCMRLQFFLAFKSGFISFSIHFCKI